MAEEFSRHWTQEIWMENKRMNRKAPSSIARET